jgi:hypothetical protein
MKTHAKAIDVVEQRELGAQRAGRAIRSGNPQRYYSGKVYHMMLGVKHAGPCGFRKMRSLIFVELLQGVLPNASAVIGLD